MYSSGNRVRGAQGTILGFFFFSSRRRHTRFDCDWSSDVCSSDLPEDLPQQAKDRALLEHMNHVHRHAAARHTVARRDLLVQDDVADAGRSEEHTSELQSQSNLVCRLLLEKKKKETSITRVST